MTYDEICYSGDEYLDTHTVVLVDDSAGPGNGRHDYLVRFDRLSKDPNIDTNGRAELAISFQKGPVGEVGINGIQDEGLLQVLINRLQHFQAGPYACRENALALTKLQEAFHWMEARKKDRVNRGVEGTSEK